MPFEIEPGDRARRNPQRVVSIGDFSAIEKRPYRRWAARTSLKHLDRVDRSQGKWLGSCKQAGKGEVG